MKPSSRNERIFSKFTMFSKPSLKMKKKLKFMKPNSKNKIHDAEFKMNFLKIHHVHEDEFKNEENESLTTCHFSVSETCHIDNMICRIKTIADMSDCGVVNFVNQMMRASAEVF